MNAISHAVTALVLKKHYREVPLVWLLLSVQATEFLWVILNYLRIERTTTEPVVRSLSDIHLAHMPWSHSALMGIVWAVLAWAVIAYGLGRPRIGTAVGLGVLSHTILDLLIHGQDMALAPFVEGPKLGMGFYTGYPFVSWFIEIAYGVWVWHYVQGGKWLLALILLVNLSAITAYAPFLNGLEGAVADRPLAFTTMIAVQIVLTLILVWLVARGRATPA